MKQEWKPGDVARIDVVPGGMTGIWTGEFWAWSNGDGPFDGVSHCHASINARPLVVIDPEDREQVERLQTAMWEAHGNEATMRSSMSWVADKLQDVLREFANPTPRIEEPTGLGAVVEDDKGNHWTRSDPGSSTPWRISDGSAFNCPWPSINAVRVLSEGVPA